MTTCLQAALAPTSPHHAGFFTPESSPVTDFAFYTNVVAVVMAQAKERQRQRELRAPAPAHHVFSMTEADCIAADLHNDHDKAVKAHRAQTLSAVNLEFKHAQQGVAA